MKGWRRSLSWLRAREALYRWVCFACALASVLVTLSIVFLLGRETLAFFQLAQLPVPAQMATIRLPAQDAILTDGGEVAIEEMEVPVQVEEQTLFETAGAVLLDATFQGKEFRATVTPEQIATAGGEPIAAQVPKQAIPIRTSSGPAFATVPPQALSVRHGSATKQVTPGEFFAGTEFAPTFTPPRYGILPLIIGTLLITVGAAAIALPLGLLSAIFMAEYCPPVVRRWVKPILEVLAGVPSIVYGYFALYHITPLLRGVFGEERIDVFNAAAGAIVVGIMTLPLVASLCDDAIVSVPGTLREGGNAMGATSFEVIKGIVIPAALSGVMAAFILAVSRAIGETMAVTLAAGQTPNITWDLGESIQTMTSFIVQITKGDAPAGGTAYLTLFAVGATLFVMTFALNWLARVVVRRFGMKYQ